MPRVIHPIAGAVALLTIATFWFSTIFTELFGSPEAVTALKTMIPWGFFVLVPAMAATGGSGFVLAGGQRRGLIGAKARRMPIIAANGLLVLIPAALYLAAKARAGEFDTLFYVVQAIELAAGATNLTLLGLSMRDGLAATRWRRGSILRSRPTLGVRLIKREAVAEGTLAFSLEKPAGFTFTAGQAVYLTLPALHSSGGTGCVRTFSIASAPHESSLRFATRVSDSWFKRQLSQLKSGTTLTIEGPFGDLSLHEDAARPAVFLAGGMGITPFRSMILDAVHRGLPHRLVLLHSTRTAADSTFLDELTVLAGRHGLFTFVPTFTASGDALHGASGETGMITRAMVERHVGDLAAPVFYVAGPPAMVSAMEAMLLGAGVTRARLRVERLPGS